MKVDYRPKKKGRESKEVSRNQTKLSRYISTKSMIMVCLSTCLADVMVDLSDVE